MLGVHRASTSALRSQQCRFVSTTRRAMEEIKSPRKWSRPIRQGVVPAYDHALGIIQRDSQAKAAKIEAIKSRIDSTNREGPEYDVLTEQLRKLEIECSINDPEVRWNFKQGTHVDMSRPVYRHLAEKKWREHGRLDLLMQRIHQMHVIPDVVSSIRPSVDLYVHFNSTNTPGNVSKASGVEPGTFLPSSETLDKPRIRATAFHPDMKLYTLAIVDLDVPSPGSRSFTTYLHYLKPNIPISATSHSNDISLDDAVIPYIPPHPQYGTPYHRYVTLLLEQADSSNPVTITTGPERLGFDVRHFVNQYGMRNEMTSWHPSANDQLAYVVGGIHMWRQKWDEGVSQVYSDILQTPEPKYGPPPKIDPYGGKKISKYL